MKFLKYCLCLFIVTIYFATLPVAAQDDGAPEIVRNMRGINQNLRTLRGQVADPTFKVQNLELIADVRRLLESSRELEPLKTSELPQAEREQFLKNFRTAIAETLKTVDQLRAAVEAGDAVTSRAHLLKLNDLKNAGHERFRKPE